MGAGQHGSDIVQGDGHLHRAIRRRLHAAARRSHRHDAIHVVFAVQETVRDENSDVGAETSSHSGKHR